MTFEEFAAQHPAELANLIDRAAARPVRTVAEHFDAYLARMASPDAQVELARLISAQKSRNTATLAVMAAESIVEQ